MATGKTCSGLWQLEVFGVRKGIIVYLEYQTVCPIFGIGSPPPRVFIPPWTQRGGGGELHYVVGGGVGDPIRMTG